MQVLHTLLLAVQILSALTMIGLILLQHGKGADMGAAFGGGSSGSLFGASGSANFLSRTTAILATVFFLTSITLTWFGTQHGTVPQGVMEKGVMERALPSKPSDVPAPAAGTQSPATVPGAAGTAGSPGSTPSEVPK